MNPQSIRTLAFIILLVHGIGHLQGVLAGTGIRMHGALSTHSWFFSKFVGERSSQVIAFLSFLLTAIFGISAALSFQGLIIPVQYWTTLALITAFLSVFNLIFFWSGFAMFFNKIGAIAVNAIIFYSILLNQGWPAVIFSD